MFQFSCRFAFFNFSSFKSDSENNANLLSYLLCVQAGDEGAVRRARSRSIRGRQLSSAGAGHRPGNAASSVAFLRHHSRLRRAGDDRRTERRAVLPHGDCQGRRPTDAGPTDADQRTPAAADQQTQVRVVLVIDSMQCRFTGWDKK